MRIFVILLQLEWASWLTPECRITTYLPVPKPSPCSLKRREAYETNTLPPGPLRDAEGRLTVLKSAIKGKLGGRQVQVDMPLAIFVFKLFIMLSNRFNTCRFSLSVVVSLAALLRKWVPCTVVPLFLRQLQLPLHSKISFRSLNAGAYYQYELSTGWTWIFLLLHVQSFPNISRHAIPATVRTVR